MPSMYSAFLICVRIYENNYTIIAILFFRNMGKQHWCKFFNLELKGRIKIYLGEYIIQYIIVLIYVIS